MSEITIGLSPITNRIYVGRLNKAKTMWNKGKQDITDQAVMTVVAYLHKEKIVYERAGKTYEIKEIEVRKLNENNENSRRV